MQRLAGLFVYCSCVFVASVASADEVHLRNGGLVRGTVMESDPTRGVRIQMADGTVRAIEASEVASVKYGRGAAATGDEGPTGAKLPIQVVSDENGIVYAAQPYMKRRRARYGPRVRVGTARKGTPTTVNLPEGLNRVTVEFDDGGSDGDDMSVEPGNPNRLDVHGLNYWHDGPRVWIGAVIPSFWMIGGEPMAQVFEVQVALTIPLADPIELRAGVRGGAGFGFSRADSGVMTHAALDGLFRFAFDSVFGMEAGLEGGLLDGEGDIGREAVPYLGPRVSLMSLRVGVHRNSELTLRNTIPIYFPSLAPIEPGFNAELAFAVMAY